ncbi:MAG: PhoH family protein [Flavobacteriales bacterium]|nr:PhoH family protein [Flavobacteriales bacterium]
MKEKIFEINSINPVELFGINDTKLDLIRKYFPKLKIIARGTTLKAIGDDDQLSVFESKLELLIDHYNKYHKLTENNIEHLMLDDSGEAAKPLGEDVIVYGNSGLQIKARTPNQRKLVDMMSKHDMVFAIGPAGTGKTYTAVALAVKALKNKEVRRIILTRPAVEAGENLGFLPGDLKEKLDPYLQPLYDALRDMLPPEKLKEFIEQGTIQIAPLAFMRGRTLDKAFVILDEAQNATEAQMKMFLTRMGMSAKFVITGDVTQVDLPRNQPSGLIKAIKVLQEVETIGFVFLDGRDVIRHKLVKHIIDAFEKVTPKEEKDDDSSQEKRIYRRKK